MLLRGIPFAFYPKGMITNTGRYLRYTTLPNSRQISDFFSLKVGVFEVESLSAENYIPLIIFLP